MQPDDADEVLTVRLRRDGDTTIVLTGDFDMHGAAAFARAVDEALRDGPDVVGVDARGVVFMDSSGLKCLLEARTQAVAAGSAIEILDPSAGVRRVIALAGLDELLLA